MIYLALSVASFLFLGYVAICILAVLWALLENVIDLFDSNSSKNHKEPQEEKFKEYWE